MAKKKKVRVDLRKNRSKPPRAKQWTRGFHDHGFAEEATAGDDHPIRVETDPANGAPRPYILIRDGLEARILRPVFYHLVDLGEAEGDRFGVWSSGRFFPLGTLEHGL